MHEIVTLQIGNQSNYAGTHFWNTQESYFTYGNTASADNPGAASGSDASRESPVDHDIHFRPGVAPDGSDTFTPRTLIYDFKQAFGTLRQVNELYAAFGEGEGADSAGIWDGRTAVQRQPAIPVNAYQRRLNESTDTESAGLSVESVRYWSDFNRVFYHPRSIVQIHESELNPNQRAFGIWEEGEELFDNLDREHDLVDRDLRPFLEECDQLQGFQLFVESSTAWAAFAARYADRVRDEYDKKALWVWALDDGAESSSSAQRSSKLVNEARALHEISPQASMYVPVRLTSPLPVRVSMNRSSRWHTSAAQAAAIETLTLPSRLRPALQQHSLQIRTASLDRLAEYVTGGDTRRNIGTLGLRVGFRQKAGDWSLCPDQDFSSDRQSRRAGQRRRQPTTFDQVVVTRGADFEQPVNGTTDHKIVIGDSHGGSPAGFRDGSEESHLQSFYSPLEFPLLDSYPRIFTVNDGESAKLSLSMQTQLATSSSTQQWIRDLAQFVRPRIALDERENVTSGLQAIAEAYQAGWSDSDSSGDDDDAGD